MFIFAPLASKGVREVSCQYFLDKQSTVTHSSSEICLDREVTVRGETRARLYPVLNSLGAQVGSFQLLWG